MLFNSYEFIFIFLPLSLAGYFMLGGRGLHTAAIGWLAAVSLFFYGWWNPAYVGLLLASISFNFLVGRGLSRSVERLPGDKLLLTLGIAGNLSLLGWYKYANFFVDNVNRAMDTGLQLDTVILPIGISFFTFTQIAYLVDAYRKEVSEYRVVHYGLFVTFFPHLVAGPVLHHKEIMPQFRLPETYRPLAENFAVGFTIFVIGLFKKVILADGVAPFATPVFDAAQAGETLTLLAAWGGALAYTLQLYFDFSGYSDMAIGLARMFGIRFPLNFNSPYKATSIIDFWRCWHMTLSRFLRDYLYIPLGGNRHGPARRHVNLFITMLLGGLWHGAGWTFVIWGGLHGLYLAVNHAWRALRSRLFGATGPSGLLGRIAGGLLTFVAVVVAWVFFRAESVDAALGILRGMAGLNGYTRDDPYYFGVREARWILALLLIVWIAPNTQQLMHRFRPAFEIYRGEIVAPRPGWLAWRPSLVWALVTVGMSVAVLTHMGRVSEFLYFQF